MTPEWLLYGLALISAFAAGYSLGRRHGYLSGHNDATLHALKVELGVVGDSEEFEKKPTTDAREIYD